MPTDFERGRGKELLKSLNNDPGMSQAQANTAQSMDDRITAKPRQGIKMDPTDDAHKTTHRPPSNGSGADPSDGADD